LIHQFAEEIKVWIFLSLCKCLKSIVLKDHSITRNWKIIVIITITSMDRKYFVENIWQPI